MLLRGTIERPIIDYEAQQWRLTRILAESVVYTMDSYETFDFIQQMIADVQEKVHNLRIYLR